MLPLVLILLSLGSYCNSAPTGELGLAIRQSLEFVKTIEQSQFQEHLKTTENVMVEKCILQSLNTFIESVRANNPTENTTEFKLLFNLKHIQEKLKGRPDLKEHQSGCKTIKQNFSNFKEKLERFLNKLNQNIMTFV